MIKCEEKVLSKEELWDHASKVEYYLPNTTFLVNSHIKPVLAYAKKLLDNLAQPPYHSNIGVLSLKFIFNLCIK